MEFHVKFANKKYDTEKNPLFLVWRKRKAKKR